MVMNGQELGPINYRKPLGLTVIDAWLMVKNGQLATVDQWFIDGS